MSRCVALLFVAALLTATSCGSGSGSPSAAGTSSSSTTRAESEEVSVPTRPLDGEWLLTSPRDGCGLDEGSVNGETLTVEADHATITNPHGPFEGTVAAKGDAFGIDLDQQFPGQTPDTLETGEALPPPNLQFDVAIGGPDTISGTGEFSMINPTGQTGAACKRTFAGVRKGSPAGDALALVERVYEPYVQHGPTLSDCFATDAARCDHDLEALLAPTLKAKLAPSFEDADPVACAQDYPTAISYDAPSVHGNLATVVVNEYFGSPDVPPAADAGPDSTATVAVDLDTMRLTDITCTLN